MADDRRVLARQNALADPTLAVQISCVATHGLLRPSLKMHMAWNDTKPANSIEGCGPWRSGPEVAPFDSNQISLVGECQVLIAERGGNR
jgi:hypothetical protein